MSELDELMEKAKKRVLARGEQSSNSEHVPAGEAFGRGIAEGIENNAPISIADYLDIKRKHRSPREITSVFVDQRTMYALRSVARKKSGKKHNRPGRKRGRRF